MLLLSRSSFSSLTPAQRARLRSLIPSDAELQPEPPLQDVGAPARVVPSVRSRLKGDGLMQSAVLDYFRSRDFEGIAVTLTFRRAHPPEYLTEEIAQGAVRELIRRLNKFATVRRSSRPLRVIAVREGGTSSKAAVRLHYHLKIEVPRGAGAENFGRKVEQYWVKLKWANRQIWIASTCDDGWLSYILKRRSKLDFADGIDWMNTHV